METIEFKIRVYSTLEGKTPFIDWLNSLKDPEARAKIRVRIDRLSLGNFGDCRHLTGKIWELRFHFGPGYRLYFGRDENSLVIFLLGGTKNKQKKDIQKAKRYWRDYQERKKDEKAT